jgi:hypothetical protein
MSSVVYRFRFLILTLVLAFLLLPSLSQAGIGFVQPNALKYERTMEFAGKAGYDEGSSGSTLPAAVAMLINVFIGLLGTIFVVLIIVSGWNWFTAQGDAKKIETAKARMLNAVIGLIIIVSAYAITVFVFRTTDEVGVMGNGGINGGPP